MMSGEVRGAAKRNPTAAEGYRNQETASKQKDNAYVLTFKGSGNSFHRNRGSYSKGVVCYRKSQEGRYFGDSNFIFQKVEFFLYHILRNHSWPLLLINVDACNPKYVCAGAKADFLEECPDGSKTNLKQYLRSKRERKILQRDISGLQANSHAFNFYFLKLEPRNLIKRNGNQSRGCCWVQEDGTRKLSGKRPKGTFQDDGNIPCFDWSFDHVGVNICQNVLSSTLKICAFYCVELYQYKNVKKKKKPSPYQ